MVEIYQGSIVIDGVDIGKMAKDKRLRYSRR